MTLIPHKTDAQLKTAVADELEWTPSVNATHIGVAVIHGVVTLSGEVESYPEKRNAEKAAQRVHGVTAIADEVTVRPAWGRVNDTDIAREAGEALERAVDVPDGSVKAVVHEHVISLTGNVAWQYQREAAGRAVLYLRGVRDVSNRVTVKPVKPLASPDGIKNSINAALVRNAQLEGKHTKVTADAHGGVTLEGTVHSWSEYRQADRLAWSAPGVTAVTNHIHVAN